MNSFPGSVYDHPPLPQPPGDLQQEKLPTESDCEADGNKNSFQYQSSSCSPC